jgi:AMP nucleosidase
MTAFAPQASAETAVDRLAEIYEASVASLRAALERFAVEGVVPEARLRESGAFVYPELRVLYGPDGLTPKVDRAFARFNQPGVYAVTVTRPDLFRTYLIEQLEPLIADYGAEVEVGPSTQEIPYPYVLDGAELPLGTLTSQELGRYFPTTHLAHIGDELVDGPVRRRSISSRTSSSRTTTATWTSSSALRGRGSRKATPTERCPAPAA